MEYTQRLPVPVRCLFCGSDSLIYKGKREELQPSKTHYTCKKCGSVRLTEEAYDDFCGVRFSNEDKNILRIVLRNEHEIRNMMPPEKCLTLDDLKQIIDLYKPLDPLAKMDNALVNIDKITKFAGAKTNINLGFDYPYYHCFEMEELRAILSFLLQEGFINAPDDRNPQTDLSISAKGYQRLREINNPGKNSRQCFVAMWFSSEMKNVYEKAIKPAIEFVEPGETEPRFTSVKIDDLDHLNDINDEIIAQIRRSRFMVCDLSGYRGGVYFEAGFAYGLGLEVIYTCNKNWTKDEILMDDSGHKIDTLYDSVKREIAVKKEGVHFDLAHRNRIEWDVDHLEDFRIKLNNRIRANIF